MSTNNAGDLRPAPKRTIDADKLHELLATFADNDALVDAAFPLRPTDGITVTVEDEEHHVQQAVYDAIVEMWRTTPSIRIAPKSGYQPEAKSDQTCLKQPAHESPRVVSAAVEMVKEIEQHKVNAAKAREEWLAQFPKWVVEMVASGERFDHFMPIRMVDGDAYCFDVSEPSGNQLVKMAEKNGLPLYADGNVPLLGDEVKHINGLRRERRIEAINGDGSVELNHRNFPKENPSDYLLRRRHPAIADLPGIVVERDTNETNGTADEANKSTIVADKYGGFVKPTSPDKGPVAADKYGDSVGQKVPKLRAGMRVKIGDSETGFLLVPASITRCWRFYSNEKGFVDWGHESDLTPIPPPLIDNGDDKFTLEGYSAFWIAQRPGGWRWEFIQNHSANGLYPHGKWFSSKEAAAEDLWRRMEGVNR